MANQSSDFEKWMRTGRTEEGRTPSVEVKFNPNHDPKNGRFTFAGQGGQSAEGTHVTRTRRSPVHPTPRKQSSGERAAIAQHPERETAAANELRVRRAANLAQAQKDLADPKVQALVDLIANRETGGRFDTIVGGSKFSNFSRHPNVYVKKYNSTAAGAYQFNAGTWNDGRLSPSHRVLT